MLPIIVVLDLSKHAFLVISDMSFNEPRTPTKDPLQFINLPEENHKREGGSVGSGNESGYSTPDPAKPKKVIYEVVV